MRWSDEHRRVQLPIKPVRKLNLAFEEFYTSGGVQVTVLSIHPTHGEALGVAVGDVCTRIDGVRPTSGAHALSLLDREPPEGGTEHMCVFRTYGFQRYGKPLLLIGAMVLTCIFLLLYELGLGDSDTREL